MTQVRLCYRQAQGHVQGLLRKEERGFSVEIASETQCYQPIEIDLSRSSRPKKKKAKIPYLSMKKET